MKAAKRKAGRPRKPEGRSPVIAGRVPESLHQKIKDASEASGRSMSEEIAWRVEMSFEWERLFADINTMRKKAETDLEKMERGNTIAALHRLGWTKIVGTQHGMVWIPPGQQKMPRSGFQIDPNLQREHVSGSGQP
jgi:Arc-like DNA binding domain